MSPAEPAFNPDTTERQDSPSLAPAPVPPGLAPWDFKEQQREYFTKLLGGKWDCEIPGHSVCVPTEDGQHHQLSDEKFAMWVDALVGIYTYSLFVFGETKWACSVAATPSLHSLRKAC